jgi:hypothetical protein
MSLREPNLPEAQTNLGRNRPLVVGFVILAVVQTAFPVAIQKLGQGIVYHQLLHAAAGLCGVAAVVAAVCQVVRPRFSRRALAACYVGLSLLAAFDLWIEGAIAASC